ncbi:hypothetical protein L345_04946 [Ophiophagus hannah]|uniref:Inter-alpha-trypsin inhibitor heavy chain C-terminal domain-containing protein n=1 Tax=Ophiophagus hannah TaxID=8665 RepID=V8P4I7_OPHHA|nr:hypothetical protein L345_04946 [Ophiophagus hannah]
MVVTKPEDNEEKESVADKPTEERSVVDFHLSSYQTMVPPTIAPYYYSSVDGDPHFMIAVPQKQDALCFNINEEPGVVLNLIRDPVTGQFFHPIDFDILEVHPGSDPEKTDATMIVKNNQLRVTRGWQKDYIADIQQGANIPCWFIHNNGDGLIDGNHTDYIVPSIF